MVLKTSRLIVSMRTAVAFGLALVSATSATATYQAATGIDAYTFDEYWNSQLHEYGSAVTWSVPNGGTYAGIESEITALSGTSSQTGDHATRDRTGTEWPVPFDPALKTDNYVPFLGTNARILDGTNTSGSGVTVSMSWRNRTDIEFDNRGYPGIYFQRPPMAYDSYNLVSDVVDLSSTPGIYVLELEYDDGQLVYDTPQKTEEILATYGFLYVGWFEDAAHAGGGNVPTQEWVNAVDGNTATGSSAVSNYQGSYADFLADPNYPDAGNLALTLGSWGVDTTDNTVWAVLDHNSEFATVPEPASLAVLSLGGFLLMRRRRD